MGANQSLYLELLRLINDIYVYSVSLGGILAFGIIVYAGIRWILSAGKQDAIKDARDQIVQAILGLGLLLLAVVILNSVPGIAEIDTTDPPTAKLEIATGVEKLTPEEHEKIRLSVEAQLKAAGGSIEAYRQIFADLPAGYKVSGQYNTPFNSAMYSFFKQVQAEEKDDDVFRVLSADEKINYIRVHHFADLYGKNNGIGNVDMTAIAADLKLPDMVALYNNLKVYEDQKYLVSFSPSSRLAEFFEYIRIIQPIMTTDFDKDNDILFRLISQLEDHRIIDLYRNSNSLNRDLILYKFLTYLRKEELINLLKSL